jgi:hypothetical protein
MKSLGNLVIIGVASLYFIHLPSFNQLLGMVIRISHFLLLFYLVWIILFDFSRTLKKKLSEKFGIHFKRLRRKIYKLKRT